MSRMRVRKESGYWTVYDGTRYVKRFHSWDRAYGFASYWARLVPLCA